ncbi:hypothetical protein [Kineococcus aurantiacus]|uniref:Uncharacterized protein n=1 Tax=Kineococcus aurantiacus TaxID=37633 RepID=A0A7Y9J3C8_9ACTN|nr:hypothetical protein [Kineococcus aurantiacus]NYD25104.1 hypothetical protein [Kineococcus aurantiacus]
MLTSRTSLDVPASWSRPSAGLLFAHRTRISTRRSRRALGCFTQALLLLRFMGQRVTVADLAHDDSVNVKTAYRYLQEALQLT